MFSSKYQRISAKGLKSFLTAPLALKGSKNL